MVELLCVMMLTSCLSVVSEPPLSPELEAAPAETAATTDARDTDDRESVQNRELAGRATARPSELSR